MNAKSNLFADQVRLLPLNFIKYHALYALHFALPHPPSSRQNLPALATLRDQINDMLQDGVPYADIVAALGPAGQHINKDNLSRWRKADHQDWLAEQHYREASAGQPDAPPEIKNFVLLLNELDEQHLQKHFRRNPSRLFNFLTKLATQSNNNSGNSSASSK